MSILDAKTAKSLEGGPSFDLRHRLLRAVWNICWLLLASWTPPPLHPWRRCLLRLFGAKISPTARIFGSATVWYPPNLEMGEHAVIGWRTLCYSMDRIVLEDYAIVSQCSFLLAGTHDIDDPNFQLKTKPIHIGRRAWVAACAIVGPGVTIGEGAVLGGGGVAFKDLEPWTVYAGNPACKVRMRKRSDTGAGS
ncbi:MAG TPA: putative colanic acid biosynthesis acetyltransferase [Methylocella sp.]|jgi:putative colanic acid biosynthesis acetyltransferase WcaF